ncbi:carbohydrate ABC transporter permease [Elusimicrobiota bacterium]
MKKIRLVSNILLIVVSLFFIFPIVWIVITSFKDRFEVLSSYSLLINRIHFENYINAWKSADFSRQYLNSLIVAILVTAGQIATSVPAGYALARMEFKGRKTVLLIILATLIIPYHVMIIPLFMMLTRLKWINTYHGLIIPMISNGFGIFLFRQFFLKVPIDIEEAAVVDGASRWTIIWKVVFPQAMPAAVTLFLFTFIAEWNDLFKWLIFTNSENMRNVQLGLSVFQEQFSVNYVQLMAAVVIITLPTLVMFIFGQKKLIEGISFEGVTK